MKSSSIKWWTVVGYHPTPAVTDFYRLTCARSRGCLRSDSEWLPSDLL